MTVLLIKEHPRRDQCNLHQKVAYQAAYQAALYLLPTQAHAPHAVKSALQEVVIVKAVPVAASPQANFPVVVHAAHPLEAVNQVAIQVAVPQHLS